MPSSCTLCMECVTHTRTCVHAHTRSCTRAHNHLPGPKIPSETKDTLALQAQSDVQSLEPFSFSSYIECFFSPPPYENQTYFFFRCTAQEVESLSSTARQADTFIGNFEDSNKKMSTTPLSLKTIHSKVAFGKTMQKKITLVTKEEKCAATERLMRF